MRTFVQRFSPVFLFINSFVYYTRCALFEMSSNSVTLKKNEMISSRKVLSRMKCAHDCDNILECNSFIYKDDQNVCILSETTKLTLRSSSLSDYGGFETDGLSVYTRVCRGGWWAFRNNCYKVMAESIPNLDDALARCETDGAYLADIRDLKEYNFVIALLSHYTWENTYFNSVWVGAGDIQQEGTYIWFHDNSPISSDVLIWVPGEPYAPIDQDCLNVIVDANNFGKFDDDSCMGVKQRSGLICKKESY